MTNNMGVFGWIRESVRRSVLLGFSDAVEQLGASAEASESLHPRLAEVLQEHAPQSIAHTSERSATPKGDRKRLGRSLEQLRQPAAKPTVED